jgi:serine/threonine-protein kinase RsbW
VHLTLPNELSYLPVALALVRAAGQRRGFDQADLGAIEVAVEEAVTNVMEHAYDPEENPSFDIACESVDDGMWVVLHEKGMPFDPRLLPNYRPEAESLDDDRDPSGIGVHLMRSLMDDVQFVNLGPEGKELRLLKRLESPDLAGPDAARPEISEPAVIQEKLEYDVRLMADHEAVEVSKCAFKSHGYSFFDDHIYYPERLVELNRSGEMISVVAVTRDGEFMGHVALLYQYPDDPTPELTFAFVNVEYRGQGVFNRLNEFLLQVPKQRPCPGLYAYAVANHVFTQKAMIRYGIRDCGILLATCPHSWKFKGIPGDPNQRISTVLSFRYLDPPKPVTLYPPAHHRDMIVRIHESLDGAATWVDQAPVPADALPESGGEVLTGFNESEGCAEIFVRGYDRDTVREVRRQLREFCLRQAACIVLTLSLEDPLTSCMTSEFEKLGFFFCGILPCTRVGDALMLQYLNNVDLAYDKIMAYSDMAVELLEYIREHDPNAFI